MPFATVAHCDASDVRKWESVRSNDAFVCERRQRGALRSTVFRIRLVLNGNSLLLWHGTSRAEALSQYESLLKPSSSSSSSLSSSPSSSSSSAIDQFWAEATNATGGGNEANSNLLELAFPDAYGVFSDALKRATLELLAFARVDSVAPSTTDDLAMLRELCSLARISTDVVVAFLQRRRTAVNAGGLTALAVRTAAADAFTADSAGATLVDLTNDLYDIQSSVPPPASAEPPPLLPLAGDDRPPLPPKKNQSRRASNAVAVSSPSPFATSPFDGIDALAGFAANKPAPTTSAPLDLDFLDNASAASPTSNRSVVVSRAQAVTAVATGSAGASLDETTTLLNGCIARIERLRVAQFDVVSCLSGAFGDGAGEEALTTRRAFIYLLPIWAPLPKPADNVWAESLSQGGELTRERVHGYMQKCVMVAKQRHPIGWVCAGFAEQFAQRFATPRGADIAQMQACIFTFVDALASGVSATFAELGSLTARQFVRDALIDVVLGSVSALVEQAFREEYRELDRSFELKRLELKRARPQMLGVPEAQCGAVERADFNKTVGVLNGFERLTGLNDMLMCVGAAMSSTVEDVRRAETTSAFSADDLLPIFCYVLLQAPTGLANFMSALRMLDAFVPDEMRNGQAGYSLVTTTVAADYLMSLNWSDLEFAAMAPLPTSASSPSLSHGATARKPRKLSLAVFGRRSSDTAPPDEATASLLSGERELNVPPAGQQLQDTLEGDAACLLSVQLCAAVVDLCKRFECFFTGSGKVSRRVRTAIRADDAYGAFVRQTQLLDGVVASGLTHQQRVVFWLNVYNALVLHAHIELAPLMVTDALDAELSAVARVTLMRSAAYRVQNHRFSLLDIEHGVLRAKSAAPSTVILALGGRVMVPKFKQLKDPRHTCALMESVPLVTFGLASMTKSAPPLRVFSATVPFQQALEQSAQRFLADHVEFDAVAMAVKLPHVLQWYKSDFGNTDSEVLRWVGANLQPDSALRQLIGPRIAELRVKYARYEWDECWRLAR
jgi:hypothetical protein